MDLIDTSERYNLPRKVEFCTRCTMSNQRPRITFRDGVCGGCRYALKKREIDWAARENELEKLLDRHRDGDGDFDVVVPCSGGKDGGYTAHQLKNRYGMRVLAVTWAPLRYTEIGRHNLDAFISSTPVDHVLGTPNPLVTANLTRESLIELGDPFQPFIYGQTHFPVKIAKLYGASLIMYGENGEVEYGGDESSADSPQKLATNKKKHYFSGLDVSDWKSRGFSQSDLNFFLDSPDAEGIDQRFFGYYKLWDPQENYYYANEHLGFTANEIRSEGTYSRYASLDDKFDGFHYFLGYIKFGIGRATSDSAHEIRDGKITREDGIELVRSYDGEFPERHFHEFLDYIKLSEDDFWSAVNRWRSPHLWEKRGSGWDLKKTIWME